MRVLICFFGVLPAAFGFASAPDLTFPAPRLDVPPFSLAETGKNAFRRVRPRDAATPFTFGRSAPRLAGSGPPMLSRMPIAKPSATIDPGFVVRPDENIDYKLLIRRPSVDSRR